MKEKGGLEKDLAKQSTLSVFSFVELPFKCCQFAGR